MNSSSSSADVVVFGIMCLNEWRWLIQQNDDVIQQHPRLPAYYRNENISNS